MSLTLMKAIGIMAATGTGLYAGPGLFSTAINSIPLSGKKPPCAPELVRQFSTAVDGAGRALVYYGHDGKSCSLHIR